MREAVRALTLNLYSIDEEEMQAFLASEYAGHYFTDLGAYITERCQVTCCQEPDRLRPVKYEYEFTALNSHSRAELLRCLTRAHHIQSSLTHFHTHTHAHAHAHMTCKINNC